MWSIFIGYLLSEKMKIGVDMDPEFLLIVGMFVFAAASGAYDTNERASFYHTTDPVPKSIYLY